VTMEHIQVTSLVLLLSEIIVFCVPVVFCSKSLSLNGHRSPWQNLGGTSSVLARIFFKEGILTPRICMQTNIFQKL
jgi:hypothetical protein